MHAFQTLWAQEVGDWELFSQAISAQALYVGHARQKQAGIKLQEYLPEAQIKTNKQIWPNQKYLGHTF